MLNTGHGTKRKTVSELIDDALIWIYAGSVTGNSKFTLPANAKDILVETTIGDAGQSISIYPMLLFSKIEKRVYSNGGYALSSNGDRDYRNVYYGITNSYIYVRGAWQDNTDYKTTCVTKVYYR